jgi:hypothetical protein
MSVQCDSSAIQTMTSGISSLGSREVEARPVRSSGQVHFRRLQARPDVRSRVRLRSALALVSQHIHSHGTGPPLYFRVTCPYSLSHAALLVCCEVNKPGILSRGAQSTHFPRLLPQSLPRWSSSSCFVTAAVFLVSMRES